MYSVCLSTLFSVFALKSAANIVVGSIQNFHLDWHDNENARCSVSICAYLLSLLAVSALVTVQFAFVLLPGFDHIHEIEEEK